MIKVQKDVPLRELNTFKIGGRAAYFLEVKTQEDLIEGISWAKRQGLPFFILGGGSNLLVSDYGYSGIILKIVLNGFHFNGEKLEAGAGANLSVLINESKNRNLSGLEWAAGIPRITVGGAVYGNAGAFGFMTADIVESIEAFDTEDEKIKQLSFKECQFDYKESIFKKNKNLIILSAIFHLDLKEKKDLEEEIKRVASHRKEHHPSEPSAGSIFKNPFQVPAGELIEKCGLKGERIGDAQVSRKHGNFIVNLGSATSSDVAKLISLIKNEVQKKYNIILEEEIQYLGF
jgi:UDP-N-acetylmuramate dehydrogenase